MGYNSVPLLDTTFGCTTKLDGRTGGFQIRYDLGELRNSFLCIFGQGVYCGSLNSVTHATDSEKDGFLIDPRLSIKNEVSGGTTRSLSRKQLIDIRSILVTETMQSRVVVRFCHSIFGERTRYGSF